MSTPVKVGNEILISPSIIGIIRSEVTALPGGRFVAVWGDAPSGGK
jgi:hypothetical protein